MAHFRRMEEPLDESINRLSFPLKKNNFAKKAEEDVRPARQDARPVKRELDVRPASRSGRAKRTLVQRELRRRSARGRKEDARPASGRSASEWTLAQEKWTLVLKRTRSGRSARQKWTLVQRGSARPLSVPERFTPGCDFTAEAHGGREELVGTSPPLPLGLLLLPSSMFVSFRVLHGNGEPNPSCWD
ncbi:hypothetical protein LR48_Vigan10g229100 [Vigna angularis]|uniref:Uncharacterized protein n=1 Tax=Phaseolus angularis TaxID=3914 RepID=A0A0L9VNS7_PHAAN|nr:hypothetical protein LR48_Vigan10g229100 [Vigna angularis]